MGRRIATLLVVSLAACASSPAPSPAPVVAPVAAPLPPPPVVAEPVAKGGFPLAPVRPSTRTLLGVWVDDPYAWMDAPRSPEIEAWTKREKDLARAALDADALRAKILARLGEHTRLPELYVDAGLAGGKLFFTRSPEPTGAGPQLHLRDGLKGSEKLIRLYRPEAGRKVRFAGWIPSPDGRLVAYGVVDASAAVAVGTVRILDTATGKWRGDAIENVGPPWVTWRRDGRSFYFTRKIPSPSGQPGGAVYLHTVGSASGSDPVVLGAGSSTEPTEPLSSIDMLDGVGRQSVALAHTGDRTSVYAAPRASVTGARTRWRKVAEVDQARVGAVLGDDVFVLTKRDAPRGRVVRINLVRPEPESAVVLPEGAATLHWLHPAADGVYVTAAEGGISRLMLVPVDGGTPATVALPLDGMILRVVTDPAQPGALVEMSSASTPPRFYRVGRSGGFDVVDLPAQEPYDFSAVSVVRLAAKSADGTSVPLAVLQWRDLARDGRNPAYIEPNVMGSSGAGPGYDPKRLAWLERGGIFASCHARELRTLGKLDKHRGVEDFIACAERLVAEGFTSPRRVGAVAEGSAAAGVAAATIERPDLFGAASFRDGLVDLAGGLSDSHPIVAARAVGLDLGGPETERDFRALLAVDAYARVQPGTRYPAMLFMMNPLARAGKPFKMAARVRASQPDANEALVIEGDGPPGGIPLLGGISTRMVASTADLYTFLFSQLAVP